MSTTTATKTFSGAGRVYLAKRGTTGVTGKFVHLGNAPQLKIGLKTDNEDLYESMSGNQLLMKRIPRKKTADVSLQVTNADMANIALGLYGTNEAVSSGTVTSGDYTAYLNGEIDLGKVNVSLVVIKDAATGLITYEVNKNYTVDADFGTVHFFTTAEQTAKGAVANIAEAEALHINFSYAAFDRVNAFTTTGDEYVLIMEGINISESGQKFKVTVHRFIPEPMKDWSLIDDKTQTIDISGAALADTSRAEGDQFLSYIEL